MCLDENLNDLNFEVSKKENNFEKTAVKNCGKWFEIDNVRLPVCLLEFWSDSSLLLLVIYGTKICERPDNPKIHLLMSLDDHLEGLNFEVSKKGNSFIFFR